MLGTTTPRHEHAHPIGTVVTFKSMDGLEPGYVRGYLSAYQALWAEQELYCVQRPNGSWAHGLRHDEVRPLSKRGLAVQHHMDGLGETR